MSRLPLPGADEGTWGTVLNDYLSVEHNADGTHRVTVNPDATTTSKGKIKLAGDLGGTADAPTVPGLSGKAIDSAVVHNSGDETIAGIKTFSSSPIVPTPTQGTDVVNKTYADSLVSAGAPDATSSTKGLVQLAGDLGGTAASPTVPGLSSKEPTITAGTTSQYWRGDKSWQALDKTAVGLGNVDNTSDAGKPVSTAAQTALDAKEDAANKGAAGGYASLDSNSIVPAAQLPANVYRLIYSTGSSSYAARPATAVVPAGYAEYVGPVQPTDWLDGDTWVDNS